ncbi:3-hydroxyisobutyryl-coenzyme A hydrolase [Ramaria rubella]|nr:3-hydroxyisobutyryl-coenzyme A hydrolase [Ramaria rubella]
MVLLFRQKTAEFHPNGMQSIPWPMLRAMSRRSLQPPVLSRTSMITRHVSSTSAAKGASMEQPRVLLESDRATRTYVLNRPEKRNALDAGMIDHIRSNVQRWDAAALCEVIVGTGKGPAFCAGGDIVSVMEASKSEKSRPEAISFFKEEFETNYLLGNLSTPYVAIMDGITMGGGVGLSVHAPFRVATENTLFAMPETKIGYVPDVGANHFLSRLDGQIGTYFSLTGTTLKGRAVFEHGIATHFVPASRIPDLRARLASLEKTNPDQVNSAIEELHHERAENEAPPPLIGAIRVAVDTAFSQKTVEDIVESLTTMTADKESEENIRTWAEKTLGELNMRSPTSLKVALEAVRRAKLLSLGEVLQMEMHLATAFINGASPDFVTGVTTLLVEKSPDRPPWSPSTLAEIPDDSILKSFFDLDSPYLATAPQLAFPNEAPPRRDYALPSEEEIGHMVLGSHPSSSDKAVTLEELLIRFEQLRDGKFGVRQKVLEVALRRCRVAKDPDNQLCLEWMH